MPLFIPSFETHQTILSCLDLSAIPVAYVVLRVATTTRKRGYYSSALSSPSWHLDPRSFSPLVPQGQDASHGDAANREIK